MARGLLILRLWALSAVLVHVQSFVPATSFTGTRPSAAGGQVAMFSAPTVVMAGKGFGKEEPKPRPPPKKKTKARIAKEKGAEKYDDMAASGIPEYNIFVKPAGTEDYLPCGAMTVPRTTQVGEAVFEQEEGLIKAARRLYSKLEEVEEFEYGYNLKMFPDDPITPVEKRAPTNNPVKKFFEGLMSPVNASGMKGPPLS